MIEVRISTDMVKRLNSNEVLANTNVIEKLRAAGVPVIGTISIQSVERGTLSMTTEEGLDGDDRVYRWTPPIKSNNQDEEEL